MARGRPGGLQATARRAADRHGLRYSSDLSDGEWALIEPAIPPAKRGGRRREVNVREVLNAIFYVLSTGCQWQALPMFPSVRSGRVAGRDKNSSNLRMFRSY